MVFQPLLTTHDWRSAVSNCMEHNAERTESDTDCWTSHIKQENKTFKRKMISYSLRTDFTPDFIEDPDDVDVSGSDSVIDGTRHIEAFRQTLGLPANTLISA